jgi:predicted DNA-binding transcriptional regulator YafY
MRADRLVAALLVLQARGRVTAAELAGELEVSVATARRDLEALSAAGVPVYPQPGRGGGWSLVGGARTDLTGLTAGEARALFALAGPAAGPVPEARAALRKLVAALPGTFRAEAEAAARAVVVDRARWGEADRSRPPLVDALRDAVVRRRRVRFGYAGRGRPAAVRVVDPWGLVDKDGVWYLVAGTDRGRRTFRVDRMDGVEVTGDPAARPEGADLAALWRETVDEVEQARSGVAATVLAPARLVPILGDRFGRHCRVEAEGGDGTPARLVVAAHTATGLAEQLAGFGTAIEVLAPEPVRTELARIGADLASRYGA